MSLTCLIKLVRFFIFNNTYRPTMVMIMITMYMMRCLSVVENWRSRYSESSDAKKGSNVPMPDPQLLPLVLNAYQSNIVYKGYRVG